MEPYQVRYKKAMEKLGSKFYFNMSVNGIEIMLKQSELLHSIYDDYFYAYKDNLSLLPKGALKEVETIEFKLHRPHKEKYPELLASFLVDFQQPMKFFAKHEDRFMCGKPVEYRVQKKCLTFPHNKMNELYKLALELEKTTLGNNPISVISEQLTKYITREKLTICQLEQESKVNDVFSKALLDAFLTPADVFNVVKEMELIL